MKRYRKSIQAAEEPAGSEKLDNAIGMLKDDFDFICSGLEKLGRDGAEAGNNALIIAERLSSSLQDIISEISSSIGG